MHNPDLLGRIKKKKNEWKWTEDLEIKCQCRRTDLTPNQSSEVWHRMCFLVARKGKCVRVKRCQTSKGFFEERWRGIEIGSRNSFGNGWRDGEEGWMSEWAAVFNSQCECLCVKGRGLFGSEKEFESIRLSLCQKFLWNFLWKTTEKF